MGPLRNARRERFCLALAEGRSAAEAYILAGYRGHRQNAHRMMTFDDVRTRLSELQSEAAKHSAVTVESIYRELDEACAVAKERGQAAPMVSASALRAKLAGLLVDKAQIEVNDRSQFAECSSIEDMAGTMLESMTNFRWLPIDDTTDCISPGLFASIGALSRASLMRLIVGRCGKSRSRYSPTAKARSELQMVATTVATAVQISLSN